MKKIIFTFCLFVVTASCGATNQDKKLDVGKSASSTGITETSKSDCFSLGEKYGKMAKDGGEKMPENYQKAQDYYLCAAKEGNALAGRYAVELSISGMANSLGDEEEIRLLKVAADANVFHAALMLSGKYCYFPSCQNPKEGKAWLIKSVSLGESVGANKLGVFYERGYEGEKRLDKAAACYKLSAKLGNELGQKNYERVLSGNKPIVSVECL